MRKNTLGFTIVELMIVVAIVGVLAAVAYPSYMEQVLRSGRSDAKVALNDVAQRMQRCFTTQSTYQPAAAGTCSVVDLVRSAAGIPSPEGFYIVRLAAADHKPNAYILKATPVENKRQNKDIKCKTLTLNQMGTRAAFDSGGVDNTKACW